jgi:hypothetical protein
MKVLCCPVRTTPEGALFFGTLPGLANLSFWQEQMQLVASWRLSDRKLIVGKLTGIMYKAKSVLRSKHLVSVYKNQSVLCREIIAA